MGKKSKKSHKKHKKQRKQSSSSEDSSSSENGSANEVEWKEKTEEKSESCTSEWLTNAGNSFDDFLGHVSSRSNQTLNSKAIAREEDRRQQESIARARELNPHIRPGNTEPVSSSSSRPANVDVRWLRRAYQRAVEQSQEPNCHRSLKEILLDRYSPQQVQEMLSTFGDRRGHGDGGSRGEKHFQSENTHRQFKRPDVDVVKNYRHRRLSPPPAVDSHSHKRKRSPSPLQRELNEKEKEKPNSFISVENNKPEPILRKEYNETEDTVTIVKEEEKFVTDDDINKMAAQLMKAEVMNDVKKITKLKSNLAKLREAKARGIKIKQTVRSNVNQSTASSSSSSAIATKASEPICVTKMSRSGVEMPVVRSLIDPSASSSQSTTRLISHNAEGQRIAFFHDDNSTDSLQQVLLKEKMLTAKDSAFEFAKMAGKAGPNTDDGEYADAFVKNNQRLDKAEDRQRRLALNDYQRHQKSLSTCQRCIEKCPKHLVISRGERFYLCLPANESLCVGHCLLRPLDHLLSCSILDEDAWRELQHFKQQLSLMFHRERKNQTLVMMETVKHKHTSSHGHTELECIPMDDRDAPVLKGYFKKALQEAGPEWSQHRKIIELKSGGDLSRTIPPGFSYFAVLFCDPGLVGTVGFAHVIEDETTFPDYFGRQVLSDLLEVGPELWRKPRLDSFRAQSQKVVEFTKWWRPYDDWRTTVTTNKSDDDNDSKAAANA